MTTIENETVYRKILKAEFGRRVEKNPRYSLRSFASYLDIHPSALSRIFSGKQSLSPRAASFIMRKLNLSEADMRTFAESLAQEKYVEVLRTLLPQSASKTG